MFSDQDVNDQKLSYNDMDGDNNIQHQENDSHPILSSSLDFLSQDQKLTLAQRSSMVSSHHNQPGAFSQTEDDSIQRNVSKDISCQKYIHPRNSPSPPPTPAPPDGAVVVVREDVPQHGTPSEVEILVEFQERMNRFQHNFETEVNTQDEDRLFHDNTQQIRIRRGVCVIFSFLILITSITVPLITRNQSESFNSPSNPESLFSIEDCYGGSYLDQNRYNNFRSIVISYHPNLTISIDEVGTSANVALCWLSQYDKLDLNPYPIHTDTLVQRFVLVTLYFHFLGRQSDINGSQKFPTWLSQDDVCDWTLVECHDDGIRNFRYVTSLDFSDVRLKSIQLPSEIALLRNLTKLNLKPIVFEGTIPLELSSLTLLEEFGLIIWGSKSGNSVGKIIQPWNRLETLRLELSLPSGQLDFGANTKLTHLELRDQVNDNDRIFPDIQELTMLQTLALDLLWSGDIPSYLWQFSNLDNLAVPNYARSIASDIGNMSKLKNLVISGQIPSEIGNLSQLTSLILQSDFFIPSEIGRLSSLEFLEIDCGLNAILAKEICDLETAHDNIYCYCQ